MLCIHKISKVVVLGALLLAGTCVQAMEPTDDNADPSVKPIPPLPNVPVDQLPDQPKTLLFMLTHDCFKEYFDAYDSENSHKVLITLRKTLNLVNQELYKHLGTLRTGFVYRFEAEDCYPRFVDRGMFNWLSGCITLQRLSLLDTGVSDTVLKSLTRLASLDLANEDTVTGLGWEKFPNLRSLFLFEVEAFESTNLAALTNLTILSVEHTDIDSKHLTPLTGLTCLTIDDIDIDSKHLTPLTGLTSLTIADTDIDSKHLAVLTRLTSLQTGYTSIIGKHFAALTGLKRLYVLCSTFENIGIFTGLTSLEVLDTKIDDTELQSLTNLKSLTLGYQHKVTGLSFGHLKNLKTLHLTNTNGIAGSCLSKLPKLEVLALNGNVEDSWFLNCINLKKVSLNEDRVNIKGDILKSLPSLETIERFGKVILQAAPGETLSPEQRDSIAKILTESQQTR